MSTLSKDGKSYYLRLSPGEHTRRPRIYIGDVRKSDAVCFQHNIGNLIKHHKTGGQMSTATLDWIGGLSNTMRDKLEKLELLEPRPSNYKFVDWAESIIREKENSPYIKPRTVTKYKQTFSRVKLFFKNETLDEVTPELADNFRGYLKNFSGLGENSIRKIISHCKGFYNEAIERDIVSKNPFKKLKSSITANPERAFFVTPELAKEVLDACPTIEWKLFFALARIGGLRIPSELQKLTWADVHLDKDRFTVHSPKTEAYEGKAVRQVPITPELKELFTAAFERADDGDVHVLPKKFRGQPSTHFKRILRNAGITPWPKIFQNCRSSRETELLKQTGGNIKFVCSVIGNSPEICMKHYAQMLEADMKQAAMTAVVKLGFDSLTGIETEPESEPEKQQNQSGQKTGHKYAEMNRNAEKHNPATGDINPLKCNDLQPVSGHYKGVQIPPD